jgi:hypothetical protein
MRASVSGFKSVSGFIPVWECETWVRDLKNGRLWAKKRKKRVRLLPQSGRPLGDPSKGSENNTIIKITNL